MILVGDVNLLDKDIKMRLRKVFMRSVLPVDMIEILELYQSIICVTNRAGGTTKGCSKMSQ